MYGQFVGQSDLSGLSGLFFFSGLVGAGGVVLQHFLHLQPEEWAVLAFA
jgi:hypothetical protein